MLTLQQAIGLADAFKNDVCDFIDMDSCDIHIKTIATIPPFVDRGLSIPQFAVVDPVLKTIILSESFLSERCSQNSFTPLRFEVYAKVCKLYLLLHPEKLGNLNPEIASIY